MSKKRQTVANSLSQCGLRNWKTVVIPIFSKNNVRKIRDISLSDQTNW